MTIIVGLAHKLIFYVQVVMIIIIIQDNLEHVLHIVHKVILINLVILHVQLSTKPLILTKLYFMVANNPIARNV